MREGDHLPQKSNPRPFHARNRPSEGERRDAAKHKLKLRDNDVTTPRSGLHPSRFPLTIAEIQQLSSPLQPKCGNLTKEGEIVREALLNNPRLQN